jgi:hypothetical protein
MKALFPLGRIVATPAMLAKIKNDAYYIATCLFRHEHGNWGVLDDEDRAANDAAVRHGLRLLSAFPLPNDPDNFWIITEADRSVTTILLPSDY